MLKIGHHCPLHLALKTDAHEAVGVQCTRGRYVLDSPVVPMSVLVPPASLPRSLPIIVIVVIIAVIIIIIITVIVVVVVVVGRMFRLFRIFRVRDRGAARG